MLYTAMLRKVYRVACGPLSEPPPEGTETGLVLVADGVGGFDLCVMGLQYALATAGVRHRVRAVPWGHGFGCWLRDLTNVDNHIARAAKVVAEVTAYRRRCPGVPVFLVGKSGGSGIIVRALEALPDGSVETAVLIASALSPGYDLSRALRAVRRELVSFWSPLDVILLGVGTAIFGTVDRLRSPAAGLVGFRRPAGADPDQYAKLRQVCWHPRMWSTGYLGGHVGPDNPRFLRTYVVPLLTTEAESGDEATAGSSPARAAPIT